MRMHNVGALVLLLHLVATGVSQADAARWGMAINSSSQECGGYWGGDEFTQYSLPPGWTAYYGSQYDAGSTVQCKTGAGESLVTPSGSCCFSRGLEQDCCKQLGLIFIAENIGQSSSSSASGSSSGCSYITSGHSTSGSHFFSDFLERTLLLSALLGSAVLFRRRSGAILKGSRG
jgi:hypothetical protein